MFLTLAACEATECAPLLSARLVRRVVFIGASLLSLLLHWTTMIYDRNMIFMQETYICMNLQLLAICTLEQASLG